MKPPGQPRRSRPIARGERITPKKRTKAEFARIHGSKERAAWFVAQRCAFCGRFPTDEQPSQQMHVEGKGMALKADADRIVPACHRCHAESHQGIVTFCERRGLTRDGLRAMAAEYDRQWRCA